MFVKNGFVFLVVPLARLPKFIHLFIDTTGMVVADDLTEFVNLFYRLQRAVISLSMSRNLTIDEP